MQMAVARATQLHQAIRPTGYASPFKQGAPLWLVGFRYSLIGCVVPSAFRFRTYLLLLCFLILGIHASGISIPLCLLMLLGWSLAWIASLTLRVYQSGSRSMNFTSFQSGLCPVLAFSGTAEVWVRTSRMSRLCYLILSCIGLPVSPM